ncbi:MAG: right-handed parallel beta-helix repeat-containing protein [Candidatus Thermoplasmatota archaeon]|nr:right-handed parallel beta-helix repeat-containing protein [Candidatus Thermoplasmatota archaeon]
MKRRTSAVAVLATLFCLIGTVLTSSASAHDENIITVGQQGNGDYRTIQQAIAYAPTGSTIIVHPGEYTEILRINKKISLIGEDREQTIINPISEQNKYALRLGAPGITIQGLSISNGAPGLYSTGIHIVASDCNINDCLFYDNPIGIAIWTSGNQITNCTFERCEDEGIAILGSESAPSNNNSIINCVFSYNCDGIELQHSSGNLIKDCEFYQNTHTGVDAIASGNDRNIIENCHIYDNRVHGIYLSASSDNQIIDCTVTGNRDGNIVMNKYAKNNQIITSSDSTEEISEGSLGLKTIMERIIDRLLSPSKDGRSLPYLLNTIIIK